MRATLFGTGVALLSACSFAFDYDGLTAGTSDAEDASAPDATPVDAGVDTGTQWAIRCGLQTCASGAHCCIDFENDSGICLAACPAGGADFACDDKSDCPVVDGASLVCCGKGTGSSARSFCAASGDSDACDRVHCDPSRNDPLQCGTNSVCEASEVLHRLFWKCSE